MSLFNRGMLGSRSFRAVQTGSMGCESIACHSRESMLGTPGKQISSLATQLGDGKHEVRFVGCKSRGSQLLPTSRQESKVGPDDANMARRAGAEH